MPIGADSIGSDGGCVPKTPPPDGLLTIAEVADRLNLTVPAVRGKVRRARLPARPDGFQPHDHRRYRNADSRYDFPAPVRLGRSLRWREADLEAYVAEMSEQ